MKRIKHIYSYEECLNLIHQFKTLNEFKNTHPHHYQYLCRNKLLPKIYKERRFETPDRTSSIGEKTFINYINKLLGIKLIKSPSLSWLKSPAGKNMSLDGYDEKNKIAFEFNGYWHHQKFVQVLDRKKKSECKKRGIKLIVLEDIEPKPINNRLNELALQLHTKLHALKLIIKRPNTKLKIVYNGAVHTKEEINDAIANSSNYTEFKKKYPRIHRFLRSRNKLHLLDHLPRIVPSYVKYTKENLPKIIAQYDTYPELRKNRGLYAAICRLKMNKEVYNQFILKDKKKTQYWTDDKLLVEVKKYQSLRDIEKRNPTAYCALKKSKLRNKFIELMKERFEEIKTKHKIQYINIKYELALDHMHICETHYEFRTKYKKSWEWLSQHKLLDKAQSERKYSKKHKPMYVARKLKYDFTDFEIQEAIKKCKTYRDFTLNYVKIYEFLRRWNKISMLDSLPKTVNGKIKVFYDAKIILKLAEQCNSFMEFLNKHNAAYNSARKKYKILPEIKLIFKKKQDVLNKKIEKQIWKLVKKSSSYALFTKNHSKAYYRAIKLGIRPQISQYYKEQKALFTKP